MTSPVTTQATGSALLDGGILSVGSSDPASIANLDFNAGTFNLTSDNLVVNPAGLFGDELILNSQKTINVTNLTTVEADGTLAVFGPDGRQPIVAKIDRNQFGNGRLVFYHQDTGQLFHSENLLIRAQGALIRPPKPLRQRTSGAHPLP
mgnify:CR=1 FL=1